MNVKLPIKKFHSDYIAIIAYALIAHGLLLLNDGVYWDGWLIYTNLLDENWNNLWMWFSESGVPIVAYLHWFMGYLPLTLFGYKLLAFLSIMFSGILIYRICNETGLVSRREGLFIALLSLSYPAFQISVELIITPFLVFYCLFLVACLLAIRSEKTSGFRHYSLRICSLTLWCLSFTINSLLVFYYGFLMILMLYARRNKALSLKQVFTRYLPHRLDYILLPFMYWIASRVLFPAHGFYSAYNELSISLSSLLTLGHTFIDNAIFTQFGNAFNYLKDYLVTYPQFAVPSILALIWLCFTSRFKSIRLLNQKVNPWALLFGGFVLLALAIVPYVAVGKVASTHGYGTRHALLISLPIAIIIVGILRLVFTDKKGSISRIGLLILATLLIAFTVSTISNYFSWQARWVKDQSVMVNLSEDKNTEGIVVFWVDDQPPWDKDVPYAFYEWSCMFKSIWGGESRIGLDQRVCNQSFLTQGSRYFNGRYHLSEFDPDGCQAMLIVRNGPNSSSDAIISTKYLFYRFFSTDRLTQFLHGVTEVQVQPISVPEAENCIIQ